MSDTPALSTTPLERSVQPDAGLADLVQAAAQLQAAEKALHAVREHLDERIGSHARAMEDEHGVAFRAVVPGVAQAYRSFSRRQLRVTDSEALAQWLRTNTPAVAERALQATTDVVVTDPAVVAEACQAVAAGGPRWWEDPSAVAAVGRLCGGLRIKETHKVFTEVLEEEFTPEAPNLITVEGEVVPGVHVTDPQPKGITVRGDQKDQKRLVQRFVHQLTGATELPG